MRSGPQPPDVLVLSQTLFLKPSAPKGVTLVPVNTPINREYLSGSYKELICDTNVTSKPSEDSDTDPVSLKHMFYTMESWSE